MDGMIFVFGSNEAGRHGKGAALYAKDYCGAEQGVGVGRTGNSYAIPTKDAQLRVLDLFTVCQYILEFLDYAEANPDLNFKITALGTGLADFSHEDMAIFFEEHSPNCYFDECWKPWLGEDAKYWGTYE